MGGKVGEGVIKPTTTNAPLTRNDLNDILATFRISILEVLTNVVTSSLKANDPITLNVTPKVVDTTPEGTTSKGTIFGAKESNVV
jgi:hypothetical protein